MDKITKLLYKKTVIHTLFYGSINKDYILDAINNWTQLLITYKTLNYLIFDYTNANMDQISILDTKIIAKETYKLIDITPNLNLIGVVPKKLDRKVTNLWQSITIFESLTVSDNLKMDRDQIMIVNSLPEATDYIEKKS